MILLRIVREWGIAARLGYLFPRRGLDGAPLTDSRPASVTYYLHAMGPMGLEPITLGLKGLCSTIELRTRGVDTTKKEPITLHC